MLDCGGEEPIEKVKSIVPQVLWGPAALIKPGESWNSQTWWGIQVEAATLGIMDEFWNGVILFMP